MSELIEVGVRQRLGSLALGGARLAMGMVLTICPVTGQELDTGIETDKQSFARTPDFVARVYCCFCACEHEWSKHQGWISEED